MTRVKRRGDSFRVRLSNAEVELLAGLARELREVLEGPTGDPVLDRLFPTAYLDPTEETAEAEWQALVRPDLLRGRLAALDVVDTTLESGAEVVMTESQLLAWLGVINDVRLTLGVRLEVTEDPDWGAIGPDHPNAYSVAVYLWLTELQGDLLGALGYD